MSEKEDKVRNLLELKEIEEKELEELTKRYLDLEDRRNENLDKLEDVNEKLTTLYQDLEK